MDERENLVREFWSERGKRIKDPTIAARFRADGRLGYDLDLVLRHCTSESRVLDLGAGSCEMSANLAPHVAHVTAVDFVEELLHKRPLPSNVTTVVSDVRTFNTEEKFDVVLLFGVLTYILDDADAESLYANAARMLAPGGTLIAKHQAGTQEDVRVDKFSEEFGTRYVAVYRHFDREREMLEQLFDVEPLDIYPPDMSRWENTHFYAFVCHARASAYLQKSAVLRSGRSPYRPQAQEATESLHYVCNGLTQVSTSRRVACFAPMPFHRRALEPIAAGLDTSLLTDSIAEIEAWKPDVIVVADGPPIPMLHEYCRSHNAILVGLQHGSVTRYMAPEQEYRLVDYFCGSEWDIRRFEGTNVPARKGMLLTGNPWVDGLFRIPERTPDRESPTILFAPTYNPEISAAGFFSGRLVDMVRRIYPESRVIIKPHPSILQYDHPYVARYRALFRRWVDDWRAEASKPGVTFVDNPGANISDYYGDADILVSDGSSLIFEFMALGRPILLFTSGKEIETWKLDPEAPGNRWRDVGEQFSSEQMFLSALSEAFARHESAHAESQRRRSADLYGEMRDGRSAERVVQAINGLPRLQVLVLNGAPDARLRQLLHNCDIHTVNGSWESVNSLLSRLSDPYVILVDASRAEKIERAEFIDDAIQAMIENNRIGAVGSFDNGELDPHFCVFDREKILSAGGFAGEGLSEKLVRAGYEALPARLYDPTAYFADGFHADEGGSRWMAAEGVLQVGSQIADERNDGLALVKMRIFCGDAGGYGQFPFALNARVGGKRVRRALFDKSHQSTRIEVVVPMGESLVLSSESSFVPSEIGGSSDSRRLSVGLSDLSVERTEKPARLIAFYLPQYHPVPENDKWWGEGFTEWTNVRRGKPLFQGHYQPHVPGELGYYDLRDPATRKAQSDLARRYGIEGFCYWHYWFNGKQLLEKPFDRMLATGEPEFPFCLAWANEDWTRTWDGRSSEILQKQEYGGQSDDTAHFDYLLRAFKDQRYMAVDGKPMFLVYRPADLPDPTATIALWRSLARESGLPGLHLVAVRTCFDDMPSDHWIEQGFDAALLFQPSFSKLWKDYDDRKLDIRMTWRNGEKGAEEDADVIIDYTDAACSLMDTERGSKTLACVIPSFDNTSRREKSAFILKNPCPDSYRDWLRTEIVRMYERDPRDRIVFINAWNEWGEGNHLEPDQRFGQAYLEATRQALDEAPNAALAERDYRAAQSLINSDQYDRAVSALEALVGAYPDHAGAHNDLGVLYAQVGDLARGIKHLEIALSISPGDRNARQNLDDIRKALKMCA